jgi:hypothetical protein
MAGYVIRATIDFGVIPDGAGTAFLNTDQSNSPGYSSGFSPGAVMFSQVATKMFAEAVPGGAAPTLANFLTALQNLANDIAGTPVGTNATPWLSQVGGLYGQPGTPLSIIQNFATGGP